MSIKLESFTYIYLQNLLSIKAVINKKNGTLPINFFKGEALALITINKKNLFHNFDLIKEKTKDLDKIGIVLKDNAYGHGLTTIAECAKDYGISNAIVKTLDEALQIQEFFSTILILGKVEFTTYSHPFHITINALEDIDQIPPFTKVELKIDTGMHRNGIAPNSLEIAISKLYDRKIILKGIFTHHRSADKLSGEFFWQNQVFHTIKSRVKIICEQLGISLPRFHSMNSAALFRCENFTEDLARVGIASYGYIDNDDGLFTPNLKPVMSLYANKVSTRNIMKNQKIGYGGGFEATTDITASTYDIGYGDGFLRINEHDHYTSKDKEPLLGRVSMDNTTFLSDKEQICIFDDVKTLAKLHKTITYEILTALSHKIPRVIIDE